MKNKIIVSDTEPYEERMPRWTTWLSRHPFKVEQAVQARYGVQ